jgi:hypothetical protein
LVRLDVADDGARIGHVDVDHGAVARGRGKERWVLLVTTPAAAIVVRRDISSRQTDGDGRTDGDVTVKWSLHVAVMWREAPRVI